MLGKKLLVSSVLALLGLAACSGESDSRVARGADGGADVDDDQDDQTGTADDDDDDEPDAGPVTQEPEPEPDDSQMQQVPVDAGAPIEPVEPEPVNLPPQAPDAEFETQEDTPLEVPLNGFDPEDEELEVDVGEPSFGTLTFDGESVTYTPDPDFTGDDTIEYSVSDGELESEVGTVTIHVLPVNDPPVAEDDSYELLEGDTLSEGNVLDNDSDVDGDELSVDEEPVVPPEFGTLTLNPDGSFSYEHRTEMGGEDSFVYEACDPDGACERGTVTLSIESVNDDPWAEDDEYNVNRDSTLTIEPPGILQNDGDPEGDPLSSTVNMEPVFGSLTLNPDGSFSYIHGGGGEVLDTFTYDACDPEGACATATVTLNILDGDANNPPLAAPDAYSVDQGGTLMATPSVIANDSDPEGPFDLTETPVTSTVNGSLTFNADGTFTYVHDGSETTSDGFSYEICDADGLCSIGSVSITVIDTNQGPVAEDDEVEVPEGDVVVANVLDNDSDSDGDLLTVTLLSPVANGSLDLGENGEFTYAHDGSETDADSFEYEVCDPDGLCDSATVSIVITPVNDPPTAVADFFNGYEGTPFESMTGLQDNDTDPDGDALTVSTTPVSGSPIGTLTIEADGTFSYAPLLDETEILFEYEVCDPDGACDVALVTLMLNNLPPVAGADDPYSCFGSTIVIPVKDNDYDPGFDPFGVTGITQQPSLGFAQLNADDTITYYPFATGGAVKAAQTVPSFVTIKYQLCDDEKACSEGTVTVEIITDQGDARCQRG